MTIFIGGNHEASNILQSLYYGGWVARNIFFLGFGGVVWFGGVRIAGLSGIYNDRHYHMGHYETPPYTPDSVRSVYHLRELEVFRIAHISSTVDIFLSHDWPNGIWKYGDCRALLAKKKFLREDVESGRLGSPPLMYLLQLLKPKYWFAAHLHVKFDALFPHDDDNNTNSHESREEEKDIDSSTLPSANYIVARPCEEQTRFTRFLALDKVLPGR